jgi:hypothetical protein
VKKSLLGVALWYFLVVNPGAGASRVGPFPSQLKCDTYRMRISRTRVTSNCVNQKTATKKAPAATSH